MATDRQADQEWVRMLKQDAPQAVRDLWELLFTYAANLQPRYGNLDDPACLVRDAAVRAFQRIRTRGVHQFRFGCPFRSYCRQILVNETNRLAARYGKQPSLVELHPETIPAEAEERPSVNQNRIRAELQPCIDRLSPRRREVIDLLYFRKKTLQEVADHLKTTRNYASVIAWRARRDLQGCLEEHGYRSSEDFRNPDAFLGS